MLQFNRSLTCTFLILHLHWRPKHYLSVTDWAYKKVEVPIYWLPIKVHYGTCANGLFGFSRGTLSDFNAFTSQDGRCAIGNLERTHSLVQVLCKQIYIKNCQHAVIFLILNIYFIIHYV